MPELPDVEIFRRYASEHALGKSIINIEYRDDSLLDSSKQAISKGLLKSRFSDTRRRGKYLFLSAGSSWLLLHFGMTGSLAYFDLEEGAPDYTRVAFHFDNGRGLAVISKRKLGRIEIQDDLEKLVGEHEIGVDALEMSSSDFRTMLENSRRGIKSALMDQKSIAGIGNIYSDEILYQEGIHPEIRAGELEDAAVDSLYQTMHRVLKKAIQNDAKPDRMPQSFLLPNRNEGARCPRCSGKIRRITVNGRGTYICPECQQK